MDPSTPACPVREDNQTPGNGADDRAPDASTNGRQIDQWLREARAGSPLAFGRALEASRKYLLMVANRALSGGLQAKFGASDLVQDTFVEAQRDFERFKGKSEEELFGWLAAILANRISHSVRRFKGTDKRDIGRELDGDAVEAELARVADAAHTPATAAIIHDDERRMRAAIAQLSEPFREVLVMRTWQRKSFQAIGLHCGCSADAARKTWSRAILQLKQILDTAP